MSLYVPIIFLCLLSACMSSFITYWQTVAKYEERIRNIHANYKRRQMFSVK